MSHSEKNFYQQIIIASIYVLYFYEHEIIQIFKQT